MWRSDKAKLDVSVKLNPNKHTLERSHHGSRQSEVADHPVVPAAAATVAAFVTAVPRTAR
jgi:hypothetical protein